MNIIGYILCAIAFVFFIAAFFSIWFLLSLAIMCNAFLDRSEPPAGGWRSLNP
jgi:hypothetical protein